MRPIKLEISGLQSFEKKQIIDFKYLTEYGLFGIFGPTGSGKSTILDAITLSIYGEVVRIKGSKEDTIDDLLNINSKEIYVLFDFAIGEDNYSIERCFKSKKSERKIGTKKVLMTKNENVVADKITEVKDEIDKIIGLNMDDFTRSVVLPQGKFSEFLKLTGADRRMMLERLFDLEFYGRELTNKVRIKKSKFFKEIEAIDNQIKGKGNIDPKDIEKCIKELGEVESTKKNIEKNFKKLELQYKKIEEIKNYTLELENYEIEKNKLEEDKKDILIIEKKLSLGKIAKEIYEKYKLYIQEEELITKTKSNLQEKSSTYSLLLEDIKNLENEVLVYKKEKSILESQLQELTISKEEWDNLAIVKLQKDSYDKLIKEIDDENINKISFQNTIEELEKIINDTEIEKSKIEKLKKNIKPIKETDIFQLEKELIQINSQEVKNLSQKIKDKKDYFEKDKEKLKKLKTQLKNIEKFILEEKKLEKKRLIIALASTLKNNSPCPVCGSKNHPNLAEELDKFRKPKDYTKDLIEVTAKIHSINLKTLQDELDLLIKELDGRDYKESLKKESLISDKIKELKKKKNEVEETLSQLDKVFNEVTETLNKQILEKVKSNEKLINNLEKLEKLEKERKNTLEILEKIDTNFVSKNKLNLKSIIDFINYVDDKHSKFNKFKDKNLNLDKDIDHKQKIIEDKKNVLQNEKEIIDSLQGELKHIEKTYKKYLENYQIVLKISGFKTINFVQENLIDNFEYLEKKVETHKKIEIEILTSIKIIKEKLNNRIYIPQEIEEVEGKLKELKSKKEETDNRLGSLISQKKHIEKVLEDIKDLLEKRKIIEKSFDIYDDLSKLLEGNKFVEYLALSKIRNIAKIASRRLANISNGHYSLTTDKNGNFLIIDNFNGGETRRSATLSGGESFLVSLSLALALSGQIQLKGMAQLEFFFLDEGFGTLDANLLDRVINSLESLRDQEGMKVGLITHVEELKERVPRKINVTASLSGEHGSLINIL